MSSSLIKEKMDNMLEENSRLKSKEAELRSERDSLGKRLAEVEAGMAAAEDAKSVAETELMTLKEKSETTLADLHRRLEAQSTVWDFELSFDV